MLESPDYVFFLRIVSSRNIVVIPTLVLLFVITPVFANTIVTGTYVGKFWVDNNKTGIFVLVLKKITDKNAAGTIQVKGTFECRAPYAFDIPYSGGDQLKISVDSQTTCGMFHYALDHDNGEFNGKMRDIFHSGKVMEAKLQ